MGSVKIILNPTAGRTARPGHAVTLAEQAVGQGYEVVVAAGGDGTTNEVVNGLMAASESGAKGVMGILPLGSGSDFAHTVGIPPDLPGACHRLAAGRPRTVDVGRVALPDRPSRHFANTMGVGFDGVVTLEARKVKRLRGLALYLPVVLKTVFLSHKCPLVTIEHDEQTMVLRALMICVANGPREGGVFLVAPQAQPDDGLFDLCIASEVSKPAMLRLIPHFMKGTHVNRAPITMVRAQRVAISSPDDLVAHMDGEVLCTHAHRITCEVLPRRLRVQC